MIGEISAQTSAFRRALKSSGVDDDLACEVTEEAWAQRQIPNDVRASALYGDLSRNAAPDLARWSVEYVKWLWESKA